MLEGFRIWGADRRIHSLAFLGEEGFDILARILEEQPYLSQAAEALGATRSTRAAPLLISLLDSSNPLTREYAAKGLRHVSDARAIDPLVRAAMSRWDSVAEHATRALAEIAGRDFGLPTGDDARPFEPDWDAIRSDVRAWRSTLGPP
jgi:HEAT repeat protein